MCHAILLDEPESLLLGTFWVILNPGKNIIWTENGLPCVFSSDKELENYLKIHTELTRCTLVLKTWEELVEVFRKHNTLKILLDEKEIPI